MKKEMYITPDTEFHVFLMNDVVATGGTVGNVGGDITDPDTEI